MAPSSFAANMDAELVKGTNVKMHVDDYDADRGAIAR